MSTQVKNYPKERLTNDQVLGLYTRIGMRIANETALQQERGYFDAKTTALQTAMTKLQGSDLTEEVEALDTARDNAYTVVRSLAIAYANGTDTTRAAAAQKVVRLLEKRPYKNLANTDYAGETSKVANLVEELETTLQSQVSTLGIGTQVQELKQANIAFEQFYINRGDEMAVMELRQAVAEARINAEEEFNFLLHVLNYKQGMYERTTANSGAGMGTGAGTGATFTDLSVCITAINAYIDAVVEAANRRRNAANNNEQPNGNGEDSNQEGDNTNQGDDNTDPNQGEDNTPSANA